MKLLRSNRAAATESTRLAKAAPLQFAEGDGECVTKLNLTPMRRDADYTVNDVEEWQSDEEWCTGEKHGAGLLDHLFDNNASTQQNDRDVTLKTPSKRKVFVNDTPVDYYDMPAIERRKLGFNF